MNLGVVTFKQETIENVVETGNGTTEQSNLLCDMHFRICI